VLANVRNSMKSHTTIASEGYIRLARVCASARTPCDVFSAVQEVILENIGYRLLTMLMLSRDGEEVQRLYTTDLANYPVAGRERLGRTPWGQHVLVEQRPFLGADRKAVRWAFPADYDLIVSLGLGATINVPIVALGMTLGSLNILHMEGQYCEADLLATCSLAPYLTVPFLYEAGYLG
jgi:hypothetical protein